MKLAVLVATAALAAAPSVFAADILKVDVPFPFQVEGKTLPAGAYEFKIDISADTVEVSAPGTGAVALVITRLAAPPHPGSNEHAHIVFDKVGTTYTLSELWEPGTDGFLVHATKGKHEHHVIHVTK